VIVYVVSLSEYDELLAEEGARPKLMQSLCSFEDWVDCQWFQSSPILLFLNNAGLFEEKMKLEGEQLSRFFRDYKGGDDVRAAIDFITKKFEGYSKVCWKGY